MTRNNSQMTTAAIVSRIDETRAAEHFRNPDRPDGRATTRRRQDPEIVKAKARIRAAAWRNRHDQRNAPTASQIGMSMVTALVTADLNRLTEQDKGLIGRMLVDLQARGFDLNETVATLRRYRANILPAPESESESGGHVVWPRRP